MWRRPQLGSAAASDRERGEKGDDLEGRRRKNFKGKMVTGEDEGEGEGEGIYFFKFKNGSVRFSST